MPKLKLTQEEKNQLKVEKKAQQLKDAEELRIKRRKDELAMEVSYSKSHMGRQRKEWYRRNYLGRFPHLKQDMQIAWHAYEHTLDLKDFIVAELTDRMDESHIQEAMSWQDYIIKVDDVIGDYLKRIRTLEEDYDQEARALVHKSKKMKYEQEKEHTNLMDYYKTVLYIMEEKATEATIAAQGEYVTKRDEEGKKGVHALEAMSAHLEKSLHMTVREIVDTLQQYKQTTETRRKEVEAMKAKNDYFMDMIKRQDSRMSKLCETMNSLHSQISENEESQLVMEDLKKDREETYTEYRQVRTSLTHDADLDDKQLLTLTMESNDVIKTLERMLEKGEKLLRMGELCRQLETQEEKVLPFGTQVQLKPEDHLEPECCGPLTLFWRKYANANLIKRKLEPNLEQLYKENDVLKTYLEMTFQIMSVTQGGV